MYIVVLPSPPGGDSAIAVLAGALHLSRLEARARVQAAQSGAAVVARFADQQAARDCAARLSADGLPSLVVARREVESDADRLAVERFELAAEGIAAHDAAGRQATLAYSAVRTILRASRLISETTTEIVRERKLSLGRAILTGGLVMTRVEKRKRQTTRGEPEGLLYVHADGQRPLCFAQLALDYRGLGSKLAPNAAENFDRLCEAIRLRCPAARWDDRLTSRTFQAALLGPALSPEQHLDLALALLRLGHTAGS